MLYCSYCNRPAQTTNSNSQHELYCKSNPNKKKKISSFGMLGKKGTNQYIKGTAKPLTEEGREKIRLKNKNRIWDEKARQKHSDSMKRAVEKNPESYTSSNRGRTKQIIYNGICFHGSWELKFYQWCENKKIKIVRNNKGFKYIWNGERTYFPDFYLPEHDTYIEVKGYKTERDNAKWEQFPNKLITVVKKDIIDIIKNSYELRL
jgi:hypothetical protein